MHARIIALYQKLSPLTENPPSRPTKADRDKLMSVRHEIKCLGDEPGIILSEEDEADRQYLYVVATQEANRQEDFYEQNGNNWA